MNPAYQGGQGGPANGALVPAGRGFNGSGVPVYQYHAAPSSTFVYCFQSPGSYSLSMNINGNRTAQTIQARPPASPFQVQAPVQVPAQVPAQFNGPQNGGNGNGVPPSSPTSS